MSFNEKGLMWVSGGAVLAAGGIEDLSTEPPALGDFYDFTYF